MSLLFKTISIFFTVLLAGVGGLLLVSMWQVPGNIQLKIVQSGSMEPSIHVGSVVLIKPSVEYAVGDVITFGPDTSKKIPTTHRIAGIERQGGVAYYTTKGDANEEADQSSIPEKEIIGKVVAHVPYIGYVLHFAKTRLGFALLIGVPALMVIIGEVFTIAGEVLYSRYKKIQKVQGVQKQTVRATTPSLQKIVKQNIQKPRAVGMDGVILKLSHHAKAPHNSLAFR